MKSSQAHAIMLVLAMLPTPALADRFDEVRAAIREELVKESLPSLSVAVAQNGKIVWEEGFGWADREKRVPADQHTIYSLASISKPITATGLMILAQEGKIALDKPANDYLGNAVLNARVGNAKDATVRRLAGHTSGLPLHYQFFYVDEYRPRPPMGETILRYGNLVSPPGETFKYSNIGYGVLDAIITRVSGVDYSDFMRTRVFLPLGLTRTSIDIVPGLEAFAATRYGEDGLPIPFYTFDHPGASAVYSSAHDLVRFAMFHLKDHLPDQQTILTEASLDEMHRPVDPAAFRDEDGSYGIGFDLRSKDGYRIVSHTGGMGGVSTSMQLFPDRDIAVVVLANASTSAVRRIVNKIQAVLLPGWKAPPAGALPEPARPAFKTPPELLGTWRGQIATYVKDQPLEVIFRSDGEVRAKIGDQMTALLDDAHLQADGTFEGRFKARIGTPDTEIYTYSIWLSVKLRGDTLGGAVAAVADGETNNRVRNALSHWVSLKKQP